MPDARGALRALSGVGMACKRDDIIPPMLVVNRREVESLIDLDELVDALAPAMVELSAGAVSLPPRIAADVPARSAFVGVMPTYLPSSETLAVKLVSVFPHNDALGLESTPGWPRFDSRPGDRLAMQARNGGAKYEPLERLDLAR